MKLLLKFFLSILIIIVLTECQSTLGKEQKVENNPVKKEYLLIDYNKDTLYKRFPAPEGFERKKTTDWAKYLRRLKLEPAGNLANFYDGRAKDSTGIYCAVLDQKIGSRDLHQCADAVMRQWATFNYRNQKYGAISFDFQSGFPFSFEKWAQGYRIEVNNQVKWYKKEQPNQDLSTFKSYLTMVYAYCGTASLEQQLKENSIAMDSMQPGDFFIQGGHPGHAVLVIDVVENEKDNKRFMLAQSYMPAQQMQILINPNTDSITPWYCVENIKGKIKTPEWTFDKVDLKRF